MRLAIFISLFCALFVAKEVEAFKCSSRTTAAAGSYFGRRRFQSQQVDQVELFERFHKGAWIGKQTLHDYTDDKKSEDEEIKRSSTFTGVCLEGDKEINHYIMRPKGDGTLDAAKVATYDDVAYLLRGNKFLHSASIGGPMINLKNRMLSCQVCIVDDDGNSRVKVIVIYDTFDEMTVPGTSFRVPETMAVSEVIIIRESRVSDSAIFRNEEKGLDLQHLPNLPKDEDLFGKSDAASIKDFEVDYKGGTRFEINYDYDDCSAGDAGDGAPAEESFSSEEWTDTGTYAIMGDDDIEEDFGLNLDQIDSPDGITFDVKMVHKGGLLIEAPRTLVANERSSITVSWKRDADKKMTTAAVSFVAMQNAVPGLKRVKGGAEAQYVQPKVLSITVEELQI